MTWFFPTAWLLAALGVTTVLARQVEGSDLSPWLDLNTPTLHPSSSSFLQPLDSTSRDPRTSKIQQHG